MALTWTSFGIASLIGGALFLAAYRLGAFGGTGSQYLASFAAVEAALLMLFLTFHQPRPGSALVETVERHLAAHPCTRPIDDHRREYRFAKAGNGTTDRRWVTFYIRRAPQPARLALGVREGWPKESGAELVARGRYERASDRLSVDYCGVTLGARHRS